LRGLVLLGFARCHIYFSLLFLNRLSPLAMKKFLTFPMHTARIPPVELTPAIRATVFEMHVGHICSPIY
jgi:hypothetical protein